MLSHQEVEKTVEEMVERLWDDVEEMVVISLEATRLQTCDHSSHLW